MSFRLVAITTLVLAAAFAGPIHAADSQPLIVGEHLRDLVLETPHPYPALASFEPKLVWSDRLDLPGASYLVLEFLELDLAPGDWVEVRDPKGEQVQIYRGTGPRGKGRDFITKMIRGSTVHIELYSKSPAHEHYGYRIERITRGYSTAELGERSIGPEVVCGIDDGQDAVCYDASFPTVYERGRPVARILMDGVALCTAWLVSCENHLITANQCTWDGFNFDSQAELDRMEFQFLYQNATCGGNDPAVEYSFLGGTWLENDHDLDYTLIRAPAGDDPASIYGWLAIDYRLPDIDETIYIVGHSGGRPKEISLYSTESADQDNPDGFCEVFSTNEPTCFGGTAPEIGYYCDSEGGGAGSPVLSRVTNRVVAMHHCPNCPNRGTRIQSIWDQNQAGLHPLPSCSLFTAAGRIELDRSRYGCSDTIAIQVTDASLLGTGSASVTLWSETEPSPETVSLTESPPDSGTFVATVNTIAGPAAADGLLSVVDSDTITARYVDLDDGAGGSNVPRDATATADCAGPLIWNIQAQNILGSAATILWNTDEPADGQILYSAAPPAWLSEGESTFETTHSVRLAGLSGCTDYFYQVHSTDEAGNVSVADLAGLYYRFTTLADVVRSYDSDAAPLPIIDRSNTYSTIQVTDTEPIIDVDVTVQLTHAYDGDVEIYLRGPNGIEIDLSSDNGGAGTDYVDTIFDDDAATSIRAGVAPFSGSFTPEQPLSTFEGLSASGDWILRVFDDEIGDGGTLLSWGLTLTFPPGPCGPHVGYDTHIPVADDCPMGGPGDADGIWDAGEEIDFSIGLENDGTEMLHAVQATLSALTPGVTVRTGTIGFGDLPAGAQVFSPSVFSIHLPDNADCGETAAFQLDIIADEGAWSDGLSQSVGRPLPTGGTILDESFDTVGIPPNWTILDGGQSIATWFTDNPADPLSCASLNPNAPIGGNWAAVDSDCAGEVNMDESLIAPQLDLASALTVSLEFDHYFLRSDTEVADVDVRSSLTNGSWVNVGRWTASTANPSHATIDITAQAAGGPDVEVRWRYYGANFAWFWYIDNVRGDFTASGGCEISVCPTGSPPDEQTGVHRAAPNALSWNADPAVTAGYSVYRGLPTDLVALTSSTLDSCLRPAGGNTIDLSVDDPPIGSFFWYLVTGSNAVGEGTAGSGSDASRIVNDNGACPP